jgi:hypothetical protein
MFATFVEPMDNSVFEGERPGVDSFALVELVGAGAVAGPDDIPFGCFGAPCA